VDKRSSSRNSERPAGTITSSDSSASQASTIGAVAGVIDFSIISRTASRLASLAIATETAVTI
jgi:hypothetical protein